MKHLDLFSGIGGFALAVDTVWPGSEHIFVDNDKFCQQVLKKHWPNSQIHGDIRQFITDTESGRLRPTQDKQKLEGTGGDKLGSQQPRSMGRVDILTGGFPCQPFSQAGRRKGTADNNGNWDACACGEQRGIIGLCNGDTTTSVQDARNAQENGAGIANLVRPNTKRSGGKRTSNESEQTTGRGTSKRSTRFTNDMGGNAPVVENRTLPSSQSTTRMEGETKNEGNTTAKRGSSSSKADTQASTKSSVSTATTQSTTSEPVLINGERVFLLTGGFPCQPFSQAGRRKGTADDRYLWPEMFRVIQLTNPTWVIAENVRGLVTWNDGMVLEQVCADLEGEGYEVQPFIIPAVAVNAPHRRDRIWIVANRKSPRTGGNDSGLRKKSIRNSGAAESAVANRTGRGSRGGQPTGDRQGQPEAQTGNGDSDAPDTGRKRPPEQQEQTAGNEQYGWSTNWIEVATELCRVDDELSSRVDRPEFTLSASAHRRERLKSLGNAIVPAVAVEIMKSIKGVDVMVNVPIYHRPPSRNPNHEKP